MLALIVLNVIAAAGSVAFAIAAFFSPALLDRTRQPSEGELIYVRLFAVRAIPLGVAVAIAPFVAWGPGTGILLLVAGVVQVLDAALALKRSDWGIVLGGTFAAVVHSWLGVLALSGAPAL